MPSIVLFYFPMKNLAFELTTSSGLIIIMYLQQDVDFENIKNLLKKSKKSKFNILECRFQTIILLAIATYLLFEEVRKKN